VAAYGIKVRALQPHAPRAVNESTNDALNAWSTVCVEYVTVIAVDVLGMIEKPLLLVHRHTRMRQHVHLDASVAPPIADLFHKRSPPSTSKDLKIENIGGIKSASPLIEILWWRAVSANREWQPSLR
jgi:hypothetical protein